MQAAEAAKATFYCLGSLGGCGGSGFKRKKSDHLAAF